MADVTDVAAVTETVGVTVTPVETDDCTVDWAQANRKKAATRTQPKILTQSTYRGIVIDLSDRCDRSNRPSRWSVSVPTMIGPLGGSITRCAPYRTTAGATRSAL